MPAVLRPGVASLAAPGTPSSRTPVTLLVGDGRSIARALARWIGQRAAGERWAVVDGGALGAEPAGPLAAPDPDLAIIGFAAGCACCVAASAFALVLARLLRRGPWHRLLIVLPVQADPGAVVDSLLAGPIAPALADLEIVCVLERVPLPGLAGLALPRAIAAADGVLVEDGSRPDTLTLAAMGTSDPGSDASWFEGPGVDHDWGRVRACLDAVRDPGRWRWRKSSVDAVAMATGLPQDGQCLTDGEPLARGGAWVWPAPVVFDRRAVEAALRAAACTPDVAQVRAVMRTRREWYAFVVSPGQTARWTPTASRRESRIECLAHPGRALAAGAMTAHWVACLVGRPAD